MRVRLVCTATSGVAVLFDPAALEGVDRAQLSSLGAVESEAASGRLFFYNLGASGECSWDLFVNEETPPEIPKRAYRSVDRLLLHVPDGVLWVAGVEKLSARSDLTEGSEQATVPPGDYKLESYLLEPYKHDEKARRNTLFDKISLAGCALSPLLVIAGVVLGLFGIWSIAITAFGVVGVYWIAYLSWFNLSGRKTQEQREEAQQLREGTPSVVVRLVHLATGEDLSVTKGGGISE